MEKQITIKRDGLLLHGLIDLPEQDEFDLVILMHGLPPTSAIQNAGSFMT